MNRTHTDSSIVEHHEDGSYTVTTVETVLPATNAQKALAVGGVGLILVAPVFPLLAMWGADKLEERRERRRKNRLKPVEDKTD